MDEEGSFPRRVWRGTARFFHWLWHGREGARMLWPRRLFLVVFTLTVLLPVGLTLIYRILPVPTTPLVAMTWLSHGTIYKVWTPIEDMSPALVRAAIGAEDARFCSHDGFDWQAIDKALRRNERGGKVRGASTISQQTAKNVFLTPHRNWVRKGLEAYFTVLIEALWPKRRIIEVYLNVAQFGPNVFGVEAAALYYYKKSASRLSATEASRLIAVLPDPEDWRVVRPGPYVTRRTFTIAARLRQVERDRIDSCVWK
jgi:monofunctional biosynthetic peptidoglycan transglycosylase